MAVAFLGFFYSCGMGVRGHETPVRVLTIFAALDSCSIFALGAWQMAGTDIVAFLLILILLVQRNAYAVKQEIDIYVKFCGRQVNLQKFPKGTTYKCDFCCTYCACFGC